MSERGNAAAALRNSTNGETPFREFAYSNLTRAVKAMDGHFARQEESTAKRSRTGTGGPNEIYRQG